MFQLNNLAPLVKKRKRVGRGGKLGGTSGRGHKGQKARSGGSVAPGFEGGQMPMARRMPKRGFNNKRFAKTYQVINLDYLETKFSDNENINLFEIKSKKFDFIKVLGTGTLTKKLIIQANAFSESAKTAITKAGGEAKLILVAKKTTKKIAKSKSIKTSEVKLENNIIDNSDSNSDTN